MIPRPSFLVIGDRATAAGDLDAIFAASLDGGCRWIMVREKALDGDALAAAAAGVVALARPYGATVLVNGDRATAAGDLDAVFAAALDGGCRWIMVREKALDGDALAAAAAEVVALARPYGATVLVNGDAQAARRAGAAGVHLPQGVPVAPARDTLGGDALIGVSAHAAAEVDRAARDGADYVTLSPVFATASKPGYGPALGLAALRGIAARAPIPVIALAGVTAGNAGACLAAGAAGVAVMGTVMRAADPRATVAALLESLAAAEEDVSSSASNE